MESAFNLQILAPIIVGLFLILLQRSPRLLHTPVQDVAGSRWWKIASDSLFLLAQMVLIGLCQFASVRAELFIFIVLFGCAFFLTSACSRFVKIGLAFFWIYVLYWIIEKYLLAFGLGDWLTSLCQCLAPVAPSLRDFAIVGTSYIGFKCIHFVVDYRSGDIENVSALDFISWMLFFPSIIAGPMQRFQDWKQQRIAAKYSLDNVSLGLQRLLIGLFMKFVLANTIFAATLSQMTLPTLETTPVWRLLLGAFCYTLYIYWDFAGYSHIAIGIGYFWGIKLPENFNSPFIARNLAEFWKRWHITLSEILRDYLFYPLSLRLKRTHFWRNYANLSAAIPPLVTFIIAGIWHGAGITFALFGLIHGIGLAYLAVRKRKKQTNPIALWWLHSKTGYVAATGINFCYVTFAFVFFALPMEKITVLGHRLLGL
jgi:D-alanyl-lipoteichoic acid acyltransferase DltB (MBOAT superfamily)